MSHTLDEIARRPELAAALPAAERSRVQLACAAILAALAGAPEPERENGDGWLTVEDVAADLKVAPSWVYARRAELGGRKFGGAVRISRRGFERWKAAQGAR